MKKTLLLTLTVLVNTLFGQNVKVFQEQSINYKKNIQTTGVEFTKKNGFGVYLSVGGNFVERVVGLNNTLNIQSESNLSGQTWWYTSPADHVGLNMTSYNSGGLWSSPQSNNQFIDQTTYRATVRSTFTENKITYTLINFGFVVPIKKTVLRIGGGLYKNVQKGEVTVQTLSTIKKVNLYWETNLESYHIIYTQNTITEKTTTSPINVNKILPNMNLSLQINRFFTVGYDSNVGMNLGMYYNF